MFSERISLATSLFLPLLFTFDFSHFDLTTFYLFHFDLTIIVNEANHSKYSFKRVSALK